jgi:hypothetical protein
MYREIDHRYQGAIFPLKVEGMASYRYRMRKGEQSHGELG